MPGKTSMSGNEWSLEEIPAEEILVAGEEALGRRGGGPGQPGTRPRGGRGAGAKTLRILKAGRAQELWQAIFP